MHRNGKNTKSSSKNRHHLLEALPVEDSMSQYGKDVASLVSSCSPRSGRDSASIASEDSSGAISQKSVSLDPVSRSLADENPSFLLYGKPNNISMNLGLGKASSFHALNETLRAVKYRQNLPENQRLQLTLRDKVNSDIEKMKTTATQHRDKAENEDFETRSYAEYSNRSYFDVDDSDDDARPPSCIRRSNSSMSNRPDSPLSNSSRGSSQSRRSWGLVQESPDFGEIENETELMLKRHENLQQNRNKPFTSRFLQKIKERRNPLLNEDDAVDLYLPISSRNKSSCKLHESCHVENWSDTIQNKAIPRASSRNAVDSGYNLNSNQSRWQSTKSTDAAVFEDKLSLTSADPYLDDDVSLSYYGLNQSPVSSLNDDENFDPKLPPRPRTSRSLKKDPIRQPGNARNSKQFVSRSLSRADETSRPKQPKYSSDYEDADYETTDALDSIISKYLYRK